jgi:hypothetical protein
MNPMDKIFRDRLENFHTAVPEDMWDVLEKRLPDNSSRKTRGLWMFSALAVCIGLSGVLLYVVTVQNESVSFKRNGKSENHTFIATNSHAQVEGYLQVPSSSANKQNTDFAGNSLVAGVSSITQDKTLNKLNRVYPQDLHYNFTQSVEKETTTHQIVSHFDTERDGEDVIDPLQVQTTIQEMPGELHRDEAEWTLDNQPYEIPQQIHNIVPTEIKAAAEEIKDPQAKACPFGESSRNAHLDVYVSHEYAMKHLTDPTSLHSEYLQMRNDTENAVYSFSAGVRLGYNVGYRWNLYTGFNYSQINERFEYTDPESQITKVIITKDYVYQQGKIVDSIITEEIVTVPGTTKLKIHNRYRTFDVPVLGRYTLYADRNISLSAVAGVFINIAFLQKGMIIGTSSNTPVDISGGPDEQKNIFKSQLGVTGYGALSMAWHVSPLFDMVIEPHFRMHTTSLTHEKYPLQQRYNTFGLTTGIRYRF